MAYEDIYGGQPVATTDDFMQNPLINNFATRGLMSGIQFISSTLSKPKNAIFGLASGDPRQLANLIPFSDTLGITNTGDPNKGLTAKPVDGRELLRHYGLADQEDTYGNFASGLALDIALDPLAWIKGPAGALTKLGETAQKAGTLDRTIAGRMASGQGGLFSIANKPWYAEMLPGAAKAENAFVAGVSPTLQQPFQKIAQVMDSGWNAATRATLPGTEFSPLAWLRSAFEPGAGNISGNPVVTDVFGQVNRPKYQELMKSGTDVVSGTNILGKQADYLNAASHLGMDNTKASVLAHDIGSYMRETGESTLPAWLTAGEDPAHVALAAKYGKDWGNVIDTVVTNPRQEAIKVGIDVGDTSKQGWKFDYAPRAQADSGNKLGMHAAARNEEFAKVPGGAAMVNKIMSDPLYAGSKKITGMDFDAAINAGTAKWAPIIQDEATKRLAKVYPATAHDVPEALVKLTTPEGAADLARKMVGHAADDGLDAATRGFFYRPDLANNLLDYPKNFAKKTATAHSAIETLSREAENFSKLVGNKPTTEGYMRLDEALKEIKLPGAADELASRIGIPKAQLEDHGVPESLVKALNKEVNPTPRGEKSAWSKMVDAFRYGVTVPWPGNFVRNWSSQVLDEGLSGTGVFKNLGSSVDILRGAMTDPAEFARMQPKLQKAIEYGVVGTDQVHALLGTGFDKAGNAAINVKPPQQATSILQSLKDFAEPMWSASKGRDVGVTPLSELAAQTSMNPTAKAAAGYVGSVVDPVRRYMGTMETAHRFQNDATRLQQFSSLLESGWSPAAAAEKVKTIQRDFLEGSTPFVSQSLRNVVPFGNFCMPPDHEILTRDGWKVYSDLTVGEEVMAYDLSTEELKWQPLLAVNVFDYSGEMLSIKRSGGMDFKFTPEHMWPVRVDDMIVKRPYGIYRYAGYRAFVKGSDIRGYHSIPTAGNFVGTGESILSPRHAAILGWVVTDGHHRWKGNYCEMVVYQHPKKSLKVIHELLGTGERARKPHPETGVVCTPVALDDVKEISKYFKSKKDLVKVVSRLSREAAESMWQAMFEAEGTTNFRNGRQQFSQNAEHNPDVLDAFQLLCLMTEKNMAIRSSEAKKHYHSKIDGRDITTASGTSYYVKTVKWMRFNAKDSGKSGRVVHKEWYSGKVWCPTTNCGTWIVRHNGHVVITGNSVQNLRTQADLLSSQTGRYSALMQLLNSGRSSGGFVPEYASSGTAIPLPGAEPGQQRFLGSLGLTQEDEMTSALTSLMSGRPTEAIRKFLSGSNPLIKVPYEMATGTQLFSGRRLDDLQPGAVASLLTGGQSPDAARTLAAVASGTPAARLFSTIDRLSDIERRGALNLLANLATGIRTVDVDQQAASQIAARDTITKLLNQSDQYKLRENLVVDPAWKGREQEMPDQIRQLFAQYEWLQKQGKIAAQQKASAGR